MGRSLDSYEHLITGGGGALRLRRHVKKHSGLSLREYEDLISATCSAWRGGLDWLRARFGEKEYKGHLGLLGTALVTCYARQRCYDYVLEPPHRSPQHRHSPPIHPKA
ncbi:hypothetical protein [Vulcanisaeta distributa]|uniref:hypothetical protein n=1 Tax=Vulcanisaeta distributa TaxID=164451 RepID=UPI0006D11998|nr:hypothetical protein [Vulcanisaeta distributa]